MGLGLILAEPTVQWFAGVFCEFCDRNFLLIIVFHHGVECFFLNDYKQNKAKKGAIEQ